MKILNINKYYYIKGGAERYYFALTKLFQDNGHQVIPFSQKDEKNFNTPYEKYFPKNKYRFFWSFKTAKNLEALIEKEKPDICHAHLIYHHLTPSILSVLKKHKIPVVLTTHDYKLICPNYLLYTQGQNCQRCKKHKYYNAVLHKCLYGAYSASALVALEMYFHKLFSLYEKNIDMIITPSKFAKNKLVEFGLSEKKIKFIPHFIDLKGKKPEFRLGDYLLYFGRLSKEKGVDNLLFAIYNSQLKIKLKIAGTGDYADTLQALAKQYKLEDRVDFLGHLNNEELGNAIKKAKLVVVPSRVWETFGLAALEAFAYGKTVLASDSGALPEVVLHNKTGVVYKNNLLEELEKIWQDENKIKKLSENAYQLVQKKFTPQQHYQELVSAYNVLLAAAS